jgi:hypothetical protein
MPRFVILEHDSPRGVHFDLMIEVGGVLKTWALPRPPEPDVEMECESLGDHRLAFLDYEGPISDGRGSVVRWDRGSCVVLEHSDAECAVDLLGERVAGTARLRREQELSGTESPNAWRLSFLMGR